MKRIPKNKVKTVALFFTMAAQKAQQATCRNARCGAVIVKRGKIIGSGYNAPPRGDEANRMCQQFLDISVKPNYDITCCVHAEWQAILTACKQYPKEIDGSTLYYMRIDDQNRFMDAGVPYCTNCSRLAMEAGITTFGLWNDEGADMYDISEYNQKSYQFFISKTV